MNRIHVIATMLLTLGSGINAQAGAFSLFGNNCGASKCCGCASSCQPVCCKPTITRPCGVSCHTYQRRCSDIKPPCCNTCCAPQSCCAPAATTCCAPAPAACAPAPAACAAPQPQACAPAPAACAAPQPQACAPAPAACAAPMPQACGPAAQSCCAPPACCNTGCCNTGCCADSCEIANLIYQSQTACYAKDRRRAIHDLGDCFDCICHPEIMCALVYGLNDSDERVRAKAADEIGDQLRKHCCCCTPEVIAALTCALGDCDRTVRRQAEEALEVCGYQIVDGCCNTCCNTCTSGACGACGGVSAPAPAPVSAEPARMQNGVAPAPVPDPEAYFPSRMNQKHTSSPNRSLGGLFGLLD